MRNTALVEHICQSLEGDRLRTVWQGLDDLQKAAVAEVVHSGATTFPAARFRAKYGRLTDFGAVSRGSRDQPTRSTRRRSPPTRPRHRMKSREQKHNVAASLN